MPNYASCALTTDGPAEAFWATVRGRARVEGVSDDALKDDGPVTLDEFSTVFRPTPEELTKVKSGSAMIGGERVSKWRTVTDPDGEEYDYAVTEAELARYKLVYGAEDWYGWNVQNLGTKWQFGAEFYPSEPRLTFETAWTPPHDFMLHLSVMFPGVRFTIAYCEMGIGYYGHVVYVDGEQDQDESWQQNGIAYREDIDELDDPALGVASPRLKELIEDYGIGLGG